MSESRFKRWLSYLFLPFIRIYKFLFQIRTSTSSEIPNEQVSSHNAGPSKFKRLLAVFRWKSEYQPIPTVEAENTKIESINRDCERIIAGVTFDDDNDVSSCATEDPTESLAAVMIVPSVADSDEYSEPSPWLLGSRRGSKLSDAMERRRGSIVSVITEPLWFLGRRSSKSAKEARWLTDIQDQEAEILSRSQILSEIQRHDGSFLPVENDVRP